MILIEYTTNFVFILKRKHYIPNGDLWADTNKIIKDGDNLPDLAIKISDLNNVNSRIDHTVII